MNPFSLRLGMLRPTGLRCLAMAAFLLFSSLVLPFFSLLAQTPTVRQFDNPSMFTPANYNFFIPAGVDSIVIEMWGAGGAPGRQSNGGDFDFYAGGGGAFIRTKSLPVVFGQRIEITVGVGSDGTFENGQVRPGGWSGVSSQMPAANAFGFSANGGQYRFGGAAADPDPKIDVSFKGGDGGIPDANRVKYGGGGAAGSPNGNGANGQNGAQGGAGAVGAGGAGNGGVGFSSFNPQRSATAGAAPGGGAGGTPAFNNNGNVVGGNGRVIIRYICRPRPGSIGNAHAITFPAELIPDSILNVQGIPPNDLAGHSYTWQRTTNLAIPVWTTAPNSTNTLSYRIDNANLNQTTYFRRATNMCGIDTFSNTIEIKVIIPIGRISGRVTNRNTNGNTNGVSGITISVQKTIDIEGSPRSKVYTTTTGADGRYTISNIYFGNTTLAGVSTPFIVTPSRDSRGFNPSSATLTFTNADNNFSNVDFVDTTVFTITGGISQVCADCQDANGNLIPPITLPLDSVFLQINHVDSGRSTYINPPGTHGRFNIGVSDPGLYNLKPRLANLSFSPASRSIDVQGNLSGQDFTTNTTYTITGKFSAGCGEYIGRARLEFIDTLSYSNKGPVPTQRFRKIVWTDDSTGSFSVTLPARRYVIRLLEFVPKDASVTITDVTNFFNTRIPKDSLLVDLFAGNRQRQLIFNRPANIVVSGLEEVCTGFSVVFQNEKRPVTVRVFQGAPENNCPAFDSTITIYSTITANGDPTTLTRRLSNGQWRDTIVGGAPNLVAPHYRQFQVSYTDLAGRQVEFDRNVIVGGVTGINQTFATVSPEIPLMVLHDPPGSGSYAFWEQNKTVETAFRMYSATTKSKSKWEEIKLGRTFEIGFGGFGISTSIEVAVWGKSQNTVDFSARTGIGNEAILSSSVTQRFSTSSSPEVVGARGDVFIGAAMNLRYGIANEVQYVPDSCKAVLTKRLLVGNQGFATTYVYTDAFIRDNKIPALKELVDNPTNTPAQKRYYADQVALWEQILENNEQNKLKASFVENRSFSGNTNQERTVTSSSKKSTTYEFGLELNNQVARELGFEIEGSGLAGGSVVSMRVESGESVTQDTLTSTTFGYVITDDNTGDFHSINIKADPVYNTPVFEVVAGGTSCPVEENTLARDEFQVSVDKPVQRGLQPNETAVYIIKLANISQTRERRTYKFSYVQSSGVGAPVVTVAGLPPVLPFDYTLDYLAENAIVVTVQRGATGVSSYENLQFLVTDACNSGISKTVTISAFFEGSCGQVNIASPEAEWVISGRTGTLVPVLINGFRTSSIEALLLEYSSAGSSTWSPILSRAATDPLLRGGSTNIDWNTTGLPDGRYFLRSTVRCNGTVFANSTRLPILIDRKPPEPFGRPEPAAGIWQPGDVLKFTYNEPLDVTGLQASQVELVRLSNNSILGANLVGYQNQLVVSPEVSLSSFGGEKFRIRLRNIADQYGNIQPRVDSFDFIISSRTAATNNRGLNVLARNTTVSEAAVNTPGIVGSLLHSFPQLAQPSVLNTDTSINFVFRLDSIRNHQVLVNFAVGGTAVFQKDYVVQFDSVGMFSATLPSFANRFNGATGSLVIPAGQREAILRIRPVNNSLADGNRTVRVFLQDGGDYEHGTAVEQTGTITNDDNKTIFVFNGSGNFDISNNWLYGSRPPSLLNNSNFEVIISPSGSECIIDKPIQVINGAKLTVAPNKSIRVKAPITVSAVQ